MQRRVRRGSPGCERLIETRDEVACEGGRGVGSDDEVLALWVVSGEFEGGGGDGDGADARGCVCWVCGAYDEGASRLDEDVGRGSVEGEPKMADSRS